MIVNGKYVISGAWTIFQHGPRKWYYCDERSIARGPFTDQPQARRGRWAYAKASGLKPDSWPEQRRSVRLRREGYLIHAYEEIGPQPATSPPASPAPPDPERAATSATRLAAKRARALKEPNGSGTDKA